MALIDPRSSHDLGSVIASRAIEFPEKNWILTPQGNYTYAEIDRQSGCLAQGIHDLGVGFGETVLVMLPDTVDFVFTWCALSKIGAVMVPVNLHYRGNLLGYLINDSLAKTLFIEVKLLDRIEALQHDLKHLERIIVYDEDDIDHVLVPEKEFPGIKFNGYRSLFASDIYCGPKPKYYDLMAVMYTSGTTGPSKGVTMTHAHAYEYAFGVIEMLELTENDVYAAPLPLFHIAGLLATIYCSCIAGATTVLTGPFSMDRFWKDISHYGVTCTFLLGAIANFIYRQPHQESDNSNSLERLLMVPLIPEVEDFKSRFDCKVSTTWGGTEFNCPTRSGFDLANNKTCGRVASDRYEVRIVDEFDQKVADGAAGEALVRCKIPWILTNGYWNHPEWTTKAWRNLWLHTGDMLMRDSEGNLYFVDRIKDAIRRRGENISSMEVEFEINKHPSVLECAVIPIEAAETEQEVMAVIVLKQNKTLEAESLIRFLESRMAYFMVPRYLEIVDDLPKTPTGKIRKFVLRNRGITSNTWDRVAAGVKLVR